MTPGCRVGAALAIALVFTATDVVGVRAGTPLRVATAVSLREAVEAAFEIFREPLPQARIELTTGPSGMLAQQARRGAPIDLLISASRAEVDSLTQEGIAEVDSRRALASDRLILAIAQPGPAATDARAALVGSRGRIAVGNPRTAPLGRYTYEALQSLELWDVLEPRLVQAESARHVLDYVARGEVFAGIVYKTHAKLAGSRVLLGPEISPALHSPIVYEGVVLEGTQQTGLARAFLDWLAGAEGRALLAERGYLPPP